MFLKCQPGVVGKFPYVEAENRIIVELNGPSAHAVHRVEPSPWGPHTMSGTNHFCGGCVWRSESELSRDMLALVSLPILA